MQRAKASKPQDSFFAEVEREKQSRRDADEEAVRSGRLSREDVSRRNGLLHGRGWRADLKSARRLW